MANAAKRNGRQALPCTMVIFGGAGDLTRRLLVPALYNLARDGRLPDGFRLVGVARTDLSSEAYRAGLGSSLRSFAPGDLDQKVCDDLIGRVSYVQGNFPDDDLYQRLAAILGELRDTGG